jgi:hypothetical protein
MDTKQYNDQKAKLWAQYKSGEFTLQEYHDLVLGMLRQRWADAMETGAPLSGISIEFTFLRSKCVREQFQPFLNDAYRAWLGNEGVPTEVLNMEFKKGER